MFNGEKSKGFQKGWNADAKRHGRFENSLRSRKASRVSSRQTKRMRVLNEAKIKKKQVKHEEIIKTIRNLANPTISIDHPTVYNLCQHLKCLACDRTHDEYLQALDLIINQGVHFRLKQILIPQPNTPFDFKLGYQASFVLTCLCTASSDHSAAFIAAGAVEVFINLLRANVVELLEQLVWALANIVGDSPQCRARVLKANGLNAILNLLNRVLSFLIKKCDENTWGMDQCLADTECKALINVVEGISFFICNICRDANLSHDKHIVPIVDVLQYLGNIQYDFFQREVLWALGYLAEHNDLKVIKLMCEKSGLDIIANGLRHKRSDICYCACRALSQMSVQADKNVMDSIYSAFILESVRNILWNFVNFTRNGWNRDEIKPIAKQAMCFVMNACAEQERHIEVLKNGSVLELVVETLKYGIDIKKEALWTVSNVVSNGTLAQVEYLVKLDCNAVLKALISTLDLHPHVIDQKKCMLLAIKSLQTVMIAGQEFCKHNEYKQCLEVLGIDDKLDRLFANENSSKDILEAADGLSKVFNADCA